MVKILLFAFDLGPARNLALLAVEALNRGHRVAMVGNQSAENCLNVADCEVLVTGLSSHQNEEELWFGEKVSRDGVSWLVLADTHLAWGRAAAKGRVGDAIAIVASTPEIGMAREFGYKDAVYLGGPPLWKTFSRITPVAIERNPGEKLILVGGAKNPEITNNFLSAVIAAMKKISVPWRLIFKPHPNENKDSLESKKRDLILSEVRLLERLESTDWLLGSVDLSIHTSDATATIVAAYQRLPVLYYEDENVRQRLLKVTGSSDWFPVKAGACNRATAETMPEEIRKLLFDEGERQKLRSRQEEVYPATQEDAPERRILDFMENLS